MRGTSVFLTKMRIKKVMSNGECGVCQKDDQVHNMIILECLLMYPMGYTVYVTTRIVHNRSGTICAGDECFLTKMHIKNVMGSVTCAKKQHDQVHNMIILECLSMYNVYVTTRMTHNQSDYTNEQRTICAGDECFLDENAHKERNGECGVCQKHD